MATTKRWTLQVPVSIQGSNSLGDKVDCNHTIGIPFYAADLPNAEVRAREILEHFKEAAEAIDWGFFQEYCSTIEDEDDLTFGEVSLVSLDGKVKKVNFQIPHLVGGP